MAVDFEEGRRTSEYRFLPEQIEVHPEMNGRHELPDIQWIVDSILRHGQLQPITIRRNAGKPVLVAGFSRWRAVSEINEKKLSEKPIELRCSYTALTEKQAFLANIEENRVRNATTPMDDAYNIQRLINIYQMTEDQVAANYRETLAWVKTRMSLIELTPEAEKALLEGRLIGSAAKAIAKLSSQQQRAVLKQEGKITSKDVKRLIAPVGAVKSEKAPKPEKPSYKELLQFIKALIGTAPSIDLYADSEDEFVRVDRINYHQLAGVVKNL